MPGERAETAILYTMSIRHYFSEFAARAYARLASNHANSEWRKLLAKLGNAGKDIDVAAPAIVKNPQYVYLGDHFFALQRLRIEAWDHFAGQQFHPKVVIGNRVIVNTDLHIGCIDRVEIGDDVLIGSRVYITDHTHGNTEGAMLLLPPSGRPLVSRGPVIIGNRVMIGEGACILPGVTIGENAIIGANAVVTQDVPAHCVAAGVPARIIKTITA